MPDTDAMSARLAEVVAHARRQAAMVGAFDPLAVLPADLASDDQELVLGELLPDCREEVIGGRVLWFMLPDARRREVAAMPQTAAERRAMAAEALTPMDSFGRHIRCALVGESVDLGDFRVADLDDMQKANQFASAVDEEAQARAVAARTRMSRAEAEESLSVVVPRRLLGRDAAMAALRTFVATGGVPREFWPRSGTGSRRRPAHISWVGICTVTGVGGSGKSALVGKLVEELREGWRGAPVIIVDFDRPRLSRADPVELLFEVTRQLGLALPQVAARLAAFRRENRALLDRFSAAAATSYDVRARVVSSALAELRVLLGGALADGGAVVLVLDTFEEVLIRPRFVAETVVRLLDALRDEAGIPNLRVVVSGRARPDEAMPSLASRLVGEIPLGDLDAADARTWLETDGFPEALAEDLVEAFGANPLVLKILTQFCKGREEGFVRSLLADGAGRKRLQGELSQQFLYTRILGRIADTSVRRLAHPGLLMRRITPEIIQHVLSGPCGLGSIGRTEALALFDRLADQVWLVRREGDGSVWHKRDLRRLMLPQVIAETDPAVVREIHERAVAYFRSDTVRGGRRTRREVEALYHELHLSPEHPVTDADALLLFTSLGPDLDDLPEGPRARLKVLAGHSYQLTASERSALDGDELVRAYTEYDSERRGFGSMTKLHASASTGERPEATLLRGEDFSDEAAADPHSPAARTLCSEFESCRFAAVARRSVPYLNGLLAFARRSEIAKPPRDPLSTAWWRVAMAGLVAPVAQAPRVSFVETAVQLLALNETASSRETMWPGGTTVAAFVAATACLVAAGDGRRAISLPREWPQFRVFTGEPVIDTIADLRVVSILLAFRVLRVEALQGARVNGGILPLFGSDFTGDERGSVPGADVAAASLAGSGWIVDELTASRAGAAAQRPTAGDLDRLVLRASEAKWQLNIPGDDRGRAVTQGLLRGLTPEVRPVLRGVLARSAEGLSACIDFADDLGGRNPLWPGEFQGDILRRSLLRDKGRWIATLLSYVDRFGHLGAFVGHVRHRVAESPKARPGLNLCARYDELLTGTLPAPTIKGRYGDA
ncbi:hypothetical protein [Methylorubrum thiocyanatum]|uniref:hypothetical protein n=1 Tax=Methylorubrum thiocyanatum TaxID=47958 RepID=UPI00366400AD